MKLLILDGNSVANKAFYGVHSLNAPDGTPTNAVQGFINILTKLRTDTKPDAVCVAFDLKNPTFRHIADEQYKANRHPMPDDFAIQMPIIRDIVSKMGINIYEKEGYEADDVLGTVGRICEENGWECVIATGDRDVFQLLTDKISVYYLGKEGVVYTPEFFEEQYGYKPINLIDYKAIAGDSSDNYPGVPGIGDKGATDLVIQYTNLDTIYNNIDNVKPALQKKLIANRDSAYHSLWLATIFKDVPINFKPEENIWNEDYTPELLGLLKNLGFYKLIDKWKLRSAEKSSLGSDPNSVCENVPEGIVLTSHLKDDIRATLDSGSEYTLNAFDTTIAQYLINPTLKNYPTDVSYSEIKTKLSELSLDKLYYEVEIPLCRVLAEMEYAGFLVDKDALFDFGESLTESIELLTQSIYGHAGFEFNINSTKQLAEVLFDKLCLPSEKKRSTNAEYLEKIKFMHPIVSDILDYRMYSKLKSTYADGLLKVIAEDGRIHTSFQQTVTATGRLSSTEPNLQNIPVRKELGSKVREMFIAAPGNVLVDADYNQIELRLLAHIANDSAMIEAFKSGADFHAYTASSVFGVPLDQVTPTLRSRAKAVNFGVVYGIGAYSLSQDIGVTRSEAKSWMDAYYAKYQGVANYMKEIVEKAQKDGFVTTIYGRRRPIPELFSSNYAEREFGKRIALNMPIQGSAADIIKIAMIKVRDELSHLNARLVLQVHDELIVECPEEEAFEVSAILRDSMEQIAALSVPLTVDVNIGRSWSEAH